MSEPIGRQTLSGVGVTLVATLVTSGSGLLSQVVLGRYLSKEDFAWYAIALSWSAFAVALRNAGTQQILVRSGPRFMELAPPVLRLSFVVNSALFAGVTLLGLAASLYYGNWTIALLMLCIGLYVPLSTYSPIFQARLASESQFLALARITASSAVLRALAAIVFAIGGLGSLSLALPFFVVALWELVAGKRATGLSIRGRAPSTTERKEILSQAKWIGFGALSVALVLNGDYLAIGLFGSAHSLAEYFFGFQLTAAVASLLTTGIQTVMLPTFVAMTDDPARQLRAFSRATVTLTIVSVGGCFLLALVAAPLIHMLWGGKWDGAAIVIQLMAITMPLRLLMPLGRALLESKGWWKFSAPLVFADGIGTFASAAIGASLGGTVAIATAVAVYRLLSSLLYYWITRSLVGALSLRGALQVLVPLGCGIGALWVALLVQRFAGSSGPVAWLAGLATFALVYALCVLALFREDCIYILETAKSSVSRIPLGQGGLR